MFCTVIHTKFQLCVVGNGCFVSIVGNNTPVVAHVFRYTLFDDQCALLRIFIIRIVSCNWIFFQIPLTTKRGFRGYTN